MILEEGFEPPKTFTTASDQLHEAVARAVGSDDFGDDEYRWGLRVLLQSMDYEARFTEQGRRIAWGSIIAMLSARAHAVRAMKQTPGFDRHAIRKPVVITGVPRTGTTALHKLMAVDPQFQGLQTWLINAPMPRPPRAVWEKHPLFQKAVEGLKKRFTVTPDLRAAHNMVAEDVEECIGILAQTFVGNLWTCGWTAPSYDAWWQTQSELPSYRYCESVIKLIGSNEPDKRWLLKNPGHICNLDLLFTIFPDALVIQTHRDPAKAIPSLCALLMQHLKVMETRDHELQARILAIREAEKWAKGARDAMPIRDKHPGQILDVIHGDFHRAPLPTVKRIYDFLGLDLSSDVAAAMGERITAAPEKSHGEHRYHVSEFGLTEDEIRERFGSYIDAFDLRPATSPRVGVRA